MYKYIECMDQHQIGKMHGSSFLGGKASEFGGGGGGLGMSRIGELAFRTRVAPHR